MSAGCQHQVGGQEPEVRAAAGREGAGVCARLPAPGCGGVQKAQSPAQSALVRAPQDRQGKQHHLACRQLSGRCCEQVLACLQFCACTGHDDQVADALKKEDWLTHGASAECQPSAGKCRKCMNNIVRSVH